MIANPKPKTYRNKHYMAFIRTLPCVVCEQQSEAHHSETGGKALKSSDLSCIPLCTIHHMQIHAMGKHTFYKRYNLDIINIRLKCLADFVWQKYPHIDNAQAIFVMALERQIETTNVFRDREDQ